MADLDRLDIILCSDDSPAGFMMLSDLDGFLHGVICSPFTIASAEWVSVELSCPMNAIPSWVRRAIAVRYVEILQGLVKEPPVVGPIFWPESHGDSVAMDWCEGFMEAVNLRPKEWLRLSESGKDS